MGTGGERHVLTNKKVYAQLNVIAGGIENFGLPVKAKAWSRVAYKAKRNGREDDDYDERFSCGESREKKK